MHCPVCGKYVRLLFSGWDYETGEYWAVAKCSKDGEVHIG